MKKGNLYVVSAPSGAGKGTILAHILQSDENIVVSISATTRKPREGEVHGTHYYFLTREDFEQKIADDFLLEYAEYAGNYYGSPSEYIDQKLDLGLDVILEIEVVGALKVKAKRPDATMIFITPPSFEELQNRLIKRGTEDIDTINKRLEIAKIEMAESSKFQHIVVNDEVINASTNILNIIKKGRV